MCNITLEEASICKARLASAKLESVSPKFRLD